MRVNLDANIAQIGWVADLQAVPSFHSEFHHAEAYSRRMNTSKPRDVFKIGKRYEVESRCKVTLVGLCNPRSLHS